MPELTKKYLLARKAQAVLIVAIFTTFVMALAMGIYLRIHGGSTDQTITFATMTAIVLAMTLVLAVINIFFTGPMEREIQQEKMKTYRAKLDAEVKAAWDKAKAVQERVREAEATLAALRQRDRTDPSRRPKA